MDHADCHDPVAHRVILYDREDRLTDTLAEFVRVGFEKDEPIVLFIRQAQRRPLTEVLSARHSDLAERVARGRLLWLDAREVYRFMDGSRPDRQRFFAFLDGLVGRFQRFRYYGGGVDVLCSGGLFDVALEFEALWNDYLKSHPGITVLCGYRLQDMPVGSHARKAVCALHTSASLPLDDHLAVAWRCITVGIIVTDSAGIVTMINPAGETLTGWGHEEALGRPITEVFPISSEYPGELFLDSRRSRGCRIKALVSDLTAPTGEKIGAIHVFRDTTDERILLDKMIQAEKLEGLGVLAGGLAHDFNNLLGGLYGYIDLASRSASLEQSKAYLQKAQNTLGRAKGLTQQLLTFSKGGSPAKEVTELAPLLRDVIGFALADANVSASFVLPDCLWPCDCDRGQISIAIANIVGNAKQAMPGGGVIDVHAENVVLDRREAIGVSSGRFVRITFKDRGITVSPDAMVRVFDPFFTSSRGSGLALSIAYSIVKRHGGTIDVESDEHRGTFFHVYLPASLNACPSSIEEKRSGRQDAGRVLVMDDEEEIREVLGAMLESLGYRVELASDGREAIGAVEAAEKRGDPFVAVIMDLMVPHGLGGKEAIAEVRRMCPSLVAIVISGYSEDSVMADPRTYGFTDRLCKPFLCQEIERMMKKYLGGGKDSALEE